jgi:hypothetical protein
MRCRYAFIQVPKMQVYRNCLLEIMIDQRLVRFQDLVLLYLDYIDVVAKGVLNVSKK